MALVQLNNGRVYFYPFCSNDFFKIANECVSCQFAHNAGLAQLTNGSLVFPLSGKLCNPNIDEYPLPLYKCSVCNKSLLDAVLSFIVLISFLTIVASLWSFVIWLRKRKKPQILFKLSIALSDFLFGAILLPSVAAQLVNTMYIPHEEYYAFSLYLDGGDYEKNWTALFSPFHNSIVALVLYISQAASLCSVLLLQIDRHIAITYSIEYHQIISRKKSVCILIIMWLIVCVFGLASTFACGTYLTKPFALFLPIVEPETDKKELLKVLLIYLLPLSVVFFTSLIICLCTSLKLYKLSRQSHFDDRSTSSSFLSSKAATRQLQKLSLYLKRKSLTSSADDQGQATHAKESGQAACKWELDDLHLDAETSSVLHEYNDRKNEETSVSQNFESECQKIIKKSQLQSEKKYRQASSRKTSRDMVRMLNN